MSTLFGGPSATNIATGFLINAGAALILVGVLVRIERRILQRLEAAEVATREVSDAVEGLSARLVELTIALDPERPRPPRREPPASPARDTDPDPGPPGPDAAGAIAPLASNRQHIRWRYRIPRLPRALLILVIAIAVATGAIWLTASLISTIVSPGTHGGGPLSGMTKATAERAGFTLKTLSMHEPVEELAFNAGELWVLGPGMTALRRVDAESSTRVGTSLRLPAPSGPLLMTHDVLWAAAEFPGRGSHGGLLRFDVDTGRQIGPTIRFQGLPYWLVATGRSVWVLAELFPQKTFELIRFGERRGKLLTRRRLPAGAEGIALVGNQLWVTSGDRILRLDPTTGNSATKPLQDKWTPRVIRSKTRVFLLTSHPDSELVEEVNPRTGAPEGHTAVVPSDCEQGAAGRHFMWLTCLEPDGKDALVMADPKSGYVKTVATGLGGSPRLWIGDGSLWLTSASAKELVRLTPNDGQL